MGKYSSGRRGGPAKTVGGRKFSRKFKSSLTRHFLFLPFKKKLFAISEKTISHLRKNYAPFRKKCIILICKIIRNIWIEYQWKQHIEPVTYFWWEAAFEKQQYRDKQKAKKCKKNNCHLIYVYEGYSFDEVAKNISQLLDEQNMR